MISTALVLIIGFVHVYILILEMFLWESHRARRAFGTTPEFAKATKVFAANQGLYNGFLAAGLFYSLWLSVAGDGRPWALFFLLCVGIAGLFGAPTANRRILFIQALPAGVALVCVIARI